jgi:alpha-tubulin suppressor-like RCC1 family protein
LGTGDKINRVTPYKLEMFSDSLNFKFGSGYWNVYRNSTHFLGFGSNTLFTLGLLPNLNVFVPTSLKGIVDDYSLLQQFGNGISFYHNILYYDNSIYTIGQNNNGQLGVGDIINRATFTYLFSSTEVFLATSTHLNTFIIFKNSSYLCSGYNLVTFLFKKKHGNCGIGDQISTLVHKWNHYFFGLNITDFYTGYTHNIVRISNGSYYGFGSNQNGQLYLSSPSYITDPTPIPYLSNQIISKISLGVYTTMVIINGSLYTVGNNAYGQQVFLYLSHKGK